MAEPARLACSGRNHVPTSPYPLGIVKPIAGTPKNIADNFSSNPDLRKTPINSLYFQVLPSNIGDIYIGLAGSAFNKTSGAGIIAILRPPTANHLPDLAWQISGCPNPYMLDQYVVDSDNSEDGVRISFQVW